MNTDIVAVAAARTPIGSFGGTLRDIPAYERVLRWNRDRVNVWGGAIALGHPTGFTGARAARGDRRARGRR